MRKPFVFLLLTTALAIVCVISPAMACQVIVPGDLNGDGVVNWLDFNVVFQNWGQPGYDQALINMISQNFNMTLATFQQQDPLGYTMCEVTCLVSGTATAAIASISVAALGFLAMQGKVKWKTALLVGAGVSAVFGASILTTSLGVGACIS
jgi:type IV secretory pathway VirB2 component (pilin)